MEKARWEGKNNLEAEDFLGKQKTPPCSAIWLTVHLKRSHTGKTGLLDTNIAYCYINFMRLIGLNHIEEFKLKHPGSRNALDRWVRLVRENDFKSITELRRVFPSADYAGAKTVFNVGGNKIRCITAIEYGVRVVVVTHVLTHEEYDKGKWKV